MTGHKGGVTSISLSCAEGLSVFVTDPTIMLVGTFRFLSRLF